MSEKYNYIENFLEGKIGWNDLDNDTEKTEVIKQIIEAINNVCSDLANDISVLRRDKNDLKERVEKLEEVFEEFLTESASLGGGDQLPESFFQDLLKRMSGEKLVDKSLFPNPLVESRGNKSSAEGEGTLPDTDSKSDNSTIQKFTVEEIRNIANNVPSSWYDSLCPCEKYAIDLINELRPDALAEGVYRALAKFLEFPLKRGKYSMEEYEKEKEIQRKAIK